jgi:hypothetical protein
MPSGGILGASAERSGIGMTAALDAASERAVKYALLHPRGRYLADRASQLSGVPRSTLYDWRRESVYAPDFDHASPVAWYTATSSTCALWLGFASSACQDLGHHRESEL